MEMPGWRVKHIQLAGSDVICLYSRKDQVVLQVRRNLRTTPDNLLDSSFKSAVQLKKEELRLLLSELLLLVA